jgi:hypothetical protein
LPDAAGRPPETTSPPDGSGGGTGATRREEPAGTGGTADGAAGGETPNRGQRPVLPEAITQEYHYRWDLDRPDPEADVVLVRHRLFNHDRELKLYRPPHRGPDPAIRDRLWRVAAQPHNHLAQIFEHSDGSGEEPAWDLQEHYPFDTLAQLLSHPFHGPRLAQDSAEQAVDQIATALSALHELGIAHRNLTPGNVLVRSLGPLEVAVTGFGLATVQEAEFTARTVTGSWGYMAPEAGWGEVGPAGDWWSLGAIVFELATGRALFSREDGTLPPDPQVRLRTGRGAYGAEAIASHRLRLLADGLLTHDPADRWGRAEVRKWTFGGSPRVIAPGPPGDAAPLPPLALLDATVTSPAELAALLRRQWEAAADLLAGRLPQDLHAWLGRSTKGLDALTVSTYAGTGGAKLVQFLGLLDPASPPVFRGVALTEENLEAQITAARKDGHTATAWLRQVREERILRAWAVAAGSAVLAELDARIDAWHTRAMTAVGRHAPPPGERRRPRLPDGAARLATGDGSPYEGLLFAAALEAAPREQPPNSETPEEPSVAAGLEAAARTAAAAYHGREHWARDLGRRVRAAASDQTALFLIAALTLPAAQAEFRAGRDAVARARRATRPEWLLVTAPLRLAAAAAYLAGLTWLRHVASWAPGPEPWSEAFAWAWHEAGVTTGVALAASLVVATGLVRAGPSYLATQIVMAGVVFGGLPALASVPWTDAYRAATPWAAEPHGFGVWPLWVAAASVVASLAARRVAGRRAGRPAAGPDQRSAPLVVLLLSGPFVAAQLLLGLSLFANTAGPGQLMDLLALDPKHEAAIAFLIGAPAPAGFRWSPLIALTALGLGGVAALADGHVYHRLRHPRVATTAACLSAAGAFYGLTWLTIPYVWTPGWDDVGRNLGPLMTGGAPVAGHLWPAGLLAGAWIVSFVATWAAVERHGDRT